MQVLQNYIPKINNRKLPVRMDSIVLLEKEITVKGS
jgi:hypothetical protein